MTPSESGELLIIQELSQRIVEAQRQIRILDSIKWDESVKQEFFKFKGKNSLLLIRLIMTVSHCPLK